MPKTLLMSGVCVALLSCFAPAGAATPSTAPAVGEVQKVHFDKPFSYFANGESLPSVLTNFAHAQGLGVDIDPAVGGKVSGRFSKVKPVAFMRAMGEAYGVSYYILGHVLYVYREADAKRELVDVPGGNANEMLRFLKEGGFVADELPGRVSVGGGALSFRGPASYIDGIRSAVRAYAAVSASKMVMRVFPIKHAWADDITLQNMDQTVTVPGIASILRGMVLGESVAGRTVTKTKGASSANSVPSLGAQGVSLQGAYKERTQKSPDAAGEAARAGGPTSVSIMADPRVNAVLISDTLDRMPYYEDVIRQLDKPVELVEIHAAIVDVDTNASRDLGVDFSGRTGSGNWQGGGSMGAGGDNENPGIITSTTGGALISTIYTHGTDYFMARISALEQENAARMLGRPSVLTIDNVEAVLENTTSYYIPLRGQEAVDLYKVDSGTVLKVTPHVIRENGKTSIKLAVSVQDDQNNSAGGYQSVGQDGSEITVNPIKQTRINTQAMVDAGQSLLIGGYYYEQKSETESGVPLLKDIPGLGALFRSSSKTGRQMERLILITPRLVNTQTQNVPERVRTAPFVRSATQPDYDMPADQKAAKTGGRS